MVDRRVRMEMLGEAVAHPIRDREDPEQGEWIYMHKLWCVQNFSKWTEYFMKSCGIENPRAKRNKYPSISICFEANESFAFDENKLPDDISSRDMLMIMEGQTQLLSNATIEAGSNILKNLSKSIVRRPQLSCESLICLH